MIWVKSTGQRWSSLQPLEKYVFGSKNPLISFQADWSFRFSLFKQLQPEPMQVKWSRIPTSCLLEVRPDKVGARLPSLFHYESYLLRSNMRIILLCQEDAAEARPRYRLRVFRISSVGFSKEQVQSWLEWIPPSTAAAMGLCFIVMMSLPIWWTERNGQQPKELNPLGKNFLASR
jgi:hypothetical protein